MGSLRNTLLRIRKRIIRAIARPVAGSTIVAESEMRSSATEYTQLPEFCAAVIANPELLRDFRRHPACTAVVETMDYSIAREIPAMILAQTPHYAELFSAFQKNDRCGNPEVYDFKKVGRIAPTTLRYVKVLSDLEVRFGNLDRMSIAEIGGGYGGQCAIVGSRFDVASYLLVDLPEVLGLARAYLGNLEIKNVSFQPWSKLERGEFDLVISNYAMSEMRRDVQEFYYERILSRSKRGYLLWNLNGSELGSMTASELVSRIPGAELIERLSPPLLTVDVLHDVGLIVWNRTA